MTNSRRFPRIAVFAAAACGVAAGCANSSTFTAGRLPYGGARTASSAASTRDPFASQSPAEPAGQPRLAPENAPQFAARPQSFAAPPSSPGPAAPAPPGTAPPGTAPAAYQVAYEQPPAGNPFSAGPDGDYSAPPQQAYFEAPVAAGAEANPFAEIEGQPAAGFPTASPAAAMTQAAPSDAWQPRAAATTSFAADEFLPPIQ